MHQLFLFIGEEPSPRALQLGVSWESGGLAGKQLHDALNACGISQDQCLYANLFSDQGVVGMARLAVASGFTVVGMGRKVQRALRDAEVEHTELVHPAARGRIRRKDLYAAHVRGALVED